MNTPIRCAGLAAILVLLLAPVAVAKPALLILSKGENALAIVDPDSLQVTKRVPVGEGPHEVCVSADGKQKFAQSINRARAGDAISFEVLRGGEKSLHKAVLAERPEQA
jgi:YVTN family beta-propeller protein